MWHRHVNAGQLLPWMICLVVGCGASNETKFHDAVELIRSDRSSSVDIRESPIQDEALFAELRGLGGLKHLNLDRSAVTDETLLSIGPLPKLRSLSLSRTKVTGASIETIVQNCPQLTYLRLDETAVTDAGLAAIADAKELTEISLFRVPIGTASCKALAKVTSLQRISLDQTMATDEALTVLGTLPKLKRISIWQCQITDTAIEKFQAKYPEVNVNR